MKKKVNCPFCDNEIEEFDTVCSWCDKSLVVQTSSSTQATEPIKIESIERINRTKPVSMKSKGVALALCGIPIFGLLGVHRFYAGKIGTGFIWMITGGVFGLGLLMDFFMILGGSFKDKSGAYICDY